MCGGQKYLTPLGSCIKLTDKEVKKALDHRQEVSGCRTVQGMSRGGGGVNNSWNNNNYI